MTSSVLIKYTVKTSWVMEVSAAQTYCEANWICRHNISHKNATGLILIQPVIMLVPVELTPNMEDMSIETRFRQFNAATQPHICAGLKFFTFHT